MSGLKIVVKASAGQAISKTAAPSRHPKRQSLEPTGDENPSKKRFNWSNFPKTQDWVDTATVKGKPLREIIEKANKIYQDEGGVGSIASDKVKNRVENIRYRKSHPSCNSAVFSSNKEDILYVDNDGSPAPHVSPHVDFSHVASPRPPEPELRMLLPNEKIDFSTINDLYDRLQDQVVRLLQTLDATRREEEELKKERDELLQFKTQTIGFYSMMHNGISNFPLTPPTAPPFAGACPSTPFAPDGAIAISQTASSQQIICADFKSSRTYTTPAIFPTGSAAQTVDSSNSPVPVSVSTMQAAKTPSSDHASAPTNSPSGRSKLVPHLSKSVESSDNHSEPMIYLKNSTSGGDFRKNETLPISQESIQSPSFRPVI